MKEMIERCVHVIAKHFCYMYDIERGSLNWLPLEIFQKILKHEMLNVRDEFSLYKVIMQYVETNKEKLNSLQISSLFEDLR